MVADVGAVRLPAPGNCAGAHRQAAKIKSDMAGWTSSASQIAKWEGMWAAGLKPGQAFDATRCEPAFADLLRGDLAGGGGRRALVPGCGRGYAVAALAAAGYQATGLEVSPTAVAAASAYLSTQEGVEGKWQIDEADFFKHTPAQPYDLIYDCTFLCAIPPEARR